MDQLLGSPADIYLLINVKNKMKIFVPSVRWAISLTMMLKDVSDVILKVVMFAKRIGMMD